MKLAIPTIHLNGTAREALEAQLEDANQALAAALEALQAAAPNGRDYYPQGPEAIALAAEQHAGRVRAVSAVRDEIQQIFEALPD